MHQLRKRVLETLRPPVSLLKSNCWCGKEIKQRESPPSLMMSWNEPSTVGLRIESTILLRLPKRITIILTLRITLEKRKQLRMEYIHYYRERKTFLRRQNLLLMKQSTLTVLIDISGNWYLNIDYGLTNAIMFIDFEKDIWHYWPWDPSVKAGAVWV